MEPSASNADPIDSTNPPHPPIISISKAKPKKLEIEPIKNIVVEAMIRETAKISNSGRALFACSFPVIIVQPAKATYCSRRTMPKLSEGTENRMANQVTIEGKVFIVIANPARLLIKPIFLRRVIAHLSI